MRPFQSAADPARTHCRKNPISFRQYCAAKDAFGADFDVFGQAGFFIVIGSEEVAQKRRLSVIGWIAFLAAKPEKAGIYGKSDYLPRRRR